MAKLDDFENSSVVWENKVLPSGEYKFELVKTNSKETGAHTSVFFCKNFYYLSLFVNTKALTAVKAITKLIKIETQTAMSSMRIFVGILK